MKACITAIGTYLPEKILTNEDFEKMVETSDEWIVKRTGIKERHVSEGESNIDMAEKAAKDLKERYHTNLDDIDFCIFCSSTTEHKIPSLASQLLWRLGIENVGSYDLSAACAGFTYGVITAQSMIQSGMCKKIMVVASEVLTRHTDYEDRTSCILFGDGASAVVIEEHDTNKVIKPLYNTEGDKGHVLYISDVAEKINGIEINNKNVVVQDGKKVFKWALDRMGKAIPKLLEQNEMTIEDIDFFVPHSANLRIIEAVSRNAKIDKSKVLESIVMCGNTSAVTIPLAIDNGLKQGRLKPGSMMMLIGFGGGLTYSGTLIPYCPK